MASTAPATLRSPILKTNSPEFANKYLRLSDLRELKERKKTFHTKLVSKVFLSKVISVSRGRENHI